MSETVKVGRKLLWAQNAIGTITAKNKSGGSVAPGDVVILDTTNSSATEVAFTTTSSADNKLVLGMSVENIANNGYGEIQREGPTSLLKVNGSTSIAVGDHIASYSAVKIGQKAGSGLGGAFAIALEAYSTGDSSGVIDAWLTGSAARIDTSSLSATYSNVTLTGTLSVSAATTYTSTGTISLTGVASGTDALTVALGDVTITDGDLSVSEVNGTSTVVTLDHESGVMAGDNALLYLDDGGNIASGGNMLRLVPTGTPDAASILFEVVGAGKIGQAMYVDGDPTGIDLVHILCGGALTDGFAALGITNDGNLATGGALLNMTLGGTPDTAARVFEIDGGSKDAIAMYVDSDAATQSAIQILGAGAVADNKAMLDVTSTGTMVAGSSIVRIHSTTASTGATVYGLEIAVNATNMEALYVSLGTTKFDELVRISTSAKLEFRDTGLYIYSSTNGQLDIVADTLLHLDSPIEVGESNAGHDVTFYTDVTNYKVWLDANGDTNGIWYFGIDDLGIDVIFSGQTTAKLAKWDASAALWEFGKNDEGIDVKFYSDTAAYLCWWDPNGDTNGIFYFGADTKGIMVKIYGDTTGCGIFWDPSTDTNGTLDVGASGGSKGNDFRCFGTTNGAYLHWDQSADDLLLVGASGIKMSVTSTLVIPVKASGSATAGDLWLDTTDNKLHFYNGSSEKTVTDS